ncbi:MAG: tetratricopeptide repeat protein [bacterium]|nr:tetratricopeptide repeat protein [bacterium]
MKPGTFMLVVILSIALSTTASAQETASTPAGATAAGTEAAPAPRADLSGANQLVRDQKYGEAETALAGLREEFPEDPSLLLMHGEVLLALGRPADARDPLARCAELDPERKRVNFQLASAMAATGDSDGAIEAFGREIAMSEEQNILVLAHLNRSMLFQQKRKWAESATELQQVLELEPTRVDVYGDLVATQLQAGKTDDAEATLTHGIEAGFTSAAPHYYSLGARFYKQKRYSKAAGALTKALELDPQLAQAERSLAATLEKLGREDEARQHLKRYLELEPDSPDAAKITEKLAEVG